VETIERTGRLSTNPIPVRERLIFALDVPDADRATALIDALGDAVTFYKVGLELILSRDLVRVLGLLAERDKRVFVDAKLHDVPQTVRAAVGQLARLGATYTTVHGTGRAMLEAACRARDESGSDLRLLAVSVLTSLDDGDLPEMGYGPDATVRELVVDRAGQALRAGFDGIVASGLDATALREAHGDDFVIVCPGIRPVDRPDDQKRVVTPEMALGAGADHIVVGRPIRDAADPRAAALSVQDRILALFGDDAA
jgi:orotidine-5'-phosphate decarboxylase